MTHTPRAHQSTDGGGIRCSFVGVTQYGRREEEGAGEQGTYFSLSTFPIMSPVTTALCQPPHLPHPHYCVDAAL